MPLTKLTANVQNVEALSNQPNASDGFTPEQVKVAFDQAAIDIKAYINGTLTNEIDTTLATKAELQGVVLGTIPDGTITEAKLAFSPATDAELSAVQSALNAAIVASSTAITSSAAYIGGQLYAYRNSKGGF